LSGADLLIANGRVVSGGRVRQCDVAVVDGAVERVEPNLSIEARRVVDAAGAYVFPGAVDAHTHPVYMDDIESLAVTAAYGGVTTVIHYAYAKPGSGLMETIERFRRDGERTSILDFGLHGGLFDPKHQSGEIPEAVAHGVTSHKMFMTYAKLGWMTDDYQLMRTLDILAEAGGMGMVHAENGLATDYLEDKYLGEGRDQKEVFVTTRPARLEAEAIGRAIAMARVAGCPIYIPHVSAALGLEPIARARAEGAFVYGETCPQYLTLTDEDLQRLGPLVKIGPPLRDPSDRDALWRALAEGLLDTVASDHAAKEKAIDDDFFDAPFGSPQVETMLALVHDGGVNGGWLPLPRLVEVMSENPARIFGLYPKKGAIEPGSDADLVVFDPTAPYEIRHASQHSRVGYTAYEGRTCLGRVALVVRRGEVLVENGELAADLGRGRFLPTAAGRIAPSSLHRTKGERDA